MLYEICLQRKLTGGALLWQVPNELLTQEQRYQTAEMYVIPTALTQPLPRSSQYPEGAYRVSPLQPYGAFSVLPGPAAGGVVIDAGQITRLGYKHPYYRYDWYSPLTGGALHIDILQQ